MTLRAAWTPSLPDKLYLEPFEATELDALLQVLSAKHPRNALRDAYYDARQVVEHLGIAVPPHLQDINTVLGWPEKAVSDLEERIDLEGFVLPGGDWSDFGLDVVWSENNLALESSQATTSALKFCTSFLAVMRGQGDEPEVLVRPMSALTSSALWDRQRRRARSGLTVVKSSPTGIEEFILYMAHAVITGTRTAKGWDVQRSAHVLGRAPVAVLPFRPSLERPMGRSRISRPVMSITDRAIRTLLRSEVTAEFFSAPQRYLLGADNDAFLDEAGSPMPGWVSLIGRVNAINADEDGERPEIWQAPQTSMQPHIDMVKAEAMHFAGETGVPPTSLGLQQDNPASDAAMKTAYMKLVKTAERAHLPFGAGWVDAARMAVMVRDGLSEAPEPLQGLAAKFRRPETPTQGEISDAMVKQISVMPWLAESEVTLERLGYSTTEIARLQSDRRRAAGRASIDKLIGTEPTEPATANAVEA